MRGVLVAGAHGGAGTSTLAALLRAEIVASRPEDETPVRDLPAFPDADPRAIAQRTVLPDGMSGPLILAARGTGEGARRAVIAVTALGYLGITPAALVVVADGAGPLPVMAAQRLGLLKGRTGTVVDLPFATGLRAGTDPDRARLPARVRRAVAALAALATDVPRSAW
jgi:hypothetical protein